MERQTEVNEYFVDFSSAFIAAAVWRQIIRINTITVVRSGEVELNLLKLNILNILIFRPPFP